MRALLLTLSILAFVVGSGTAVQAGYYGFTISASSVDPFVNNPENPGAGVHALHLWTLPGCNLDGSGGVAWSAAEFKISSTGWTVAGFTPHFGFVEIGPAPDATGKNFLIGSGWCTLPNKARVIGQLTVMSSGTGGAMELGVTDAFPGSLQWAVAVTCDPLPAPIAWPEAIRFVGYSTRDLGANQDEGSGGPLTRPVSVEETTWGMIKALYR